MSARHPPAIDLAARTGRALVDLLLPPHCAACDELVDRPGLLCAACFRRTGFITEPLCARCGVPFGSAAVGGPDGLCPSCRIAPPLFGRARAPLRYDEQGRRMILPFKHADRTETVAVLALQMARAGAELLRQADVLVPVPLHRWRLFLRRYNQAALLARAVGRLAGRASVLDALVRRRATEALGDKSAAERATEVAGAFAVPARRVAKIASRRVLLVDDVLTSGATANACAQALLAAGAASVDVLAAARVPDPRLN